MAANAVGVGGGPAGVDLHVATNRPTRLLQPLRKRRDAGLHYRIIRGERHKHANAPHPARLLRARCERQRDSRTAEQRDELASLHSITSSARNRIDVGTSRPIALAVLTLTVSSNLVGACTGRSAGFSPLRMRST